MQSLSQSSSVALMRGSTYSLSRLLCSKRQQDLSRLATWQKERRAESWSWAPSLMGNPQTAVRDTTYKRKGICRMVAEKIEDSDLEVYSKR